MQATLQLTGFYLGILAILFLVLSFRVIGFRRSLAVGIGDSNGQHKVLSKAIRVHANFFEYVPLAMLLFATAEINMLAANWLHASGATLVICRVFHAQGLMKSTGATWQRFIGTLGTFLVILALAVFNIAQLVIS